MLARAPDLLARARRPARAPQRSGEGAPGRVCARPTPCPGTSNTHPSPRRRRPAGPSPPADLASQLSTQLSLLQQLRDLQGLQGALGAQLAGAWPGGAAAAAAAGALLGPPPRRAAAAADAAKVRRTVYVADVDPAASEAALRALFAPCGAVLDARVCGDPRGATRFAFLEFADGAGAGAALGLTGAPLGAYAIRVSPSKTAIVPINGRFLPRSEEERAAVARTVYVANVARGVERAAIVDFFARAAGPVAKVRVLGGDASLPTKICFLEMATAEGAARAVGLSGAALAGLPIRVAPSKTPVRASAREPAAGGAAGAAQLQALLFAAEGGGGGGAAPPPHEAAYAPAYDPGAAAAYDPAAPHAGSALAAHAFAGGAFAGGFRGGPFP